MKSLVLLSLVLGCSPADSPTFTIDAALDDAATGPFAFCPTTIDVFGYSNVLNQGCGGLGPDPTGFADGLFEPGTLGYDRTLAGRLQARLAADPELAERFGSEWHVRSCSVGGGTMGTFVPTEQDPADQSGRTGRNIAMCTNDPAPLVLYSANNVADTFHGGGVGATLDDPAEYAEHWALRFEEFRQLRQPAALLVSPQHEWHGEQGGAPDGDLEDCTWQRPAWNRLGLERWQTDHASAIEVLDIGDRQEEFKQHHSCCAVLGVSCLDSWFDQGDGWVHFDCQGADALEEMWFLALRGYLLANAFTCP